MAKKKVGIWIRVSTEDQAKGESPEHHEVRARKYADVKDWEVVEIYNLAGVSGKSVIEHPEAQRMITDIRNGHITGLIFSKIARLARNTKELLEFSELFRQNDADLVSIYENLDTSSPAGRLFYTIIAAMAEWEREEIVSRIRSSVQVRAKLGKSLGGRAQFGFDWKNNELVLNPEEAPIRKLMYELFLKEKKKTSVATILNDKGYRTRKGAKFGRGVINRYLRDPISKGLRRVNYSEINPITKGMSLKPKEEWIFHPCPAIVSEELWQQVNDILTEQDSNRKPILNKKVHIFTNYIFCHCDSRMNVRSKLVHYKCVNKECTNKIRRDDLEDAFKSRLIQFLSNKKELEKYFKQSEVSLKKKDDELTLLKKKLKESQEELKSLLELHQKGQIPTDAFGEYHKKPFEKSKQLEQGIVNLENLIVSETQQKNATSIIVKDSKNIYSQWDTFERDKKREIIEGVVESIIIGSDEIEFNLKRLNPFTSSSSFTSAGSSDSTNVSNYKATSVYRKSPINKGKMGDETRWFCNA